MFGALGYVMDRWNLVATKNQSSISLQGGPQPVINGVITPILGL